MRRLTALAVWIVAACGELLSSPAIAVDGYDTLPWDDLAVIDRVERGIQGFYTLDSTIYRGSRPLVTECSYMVIQEALGMRHFDGRWGRVVRWTAIRQSNGLVGYGGT